VNTFHQSVNSSKIYNALITFFL